MCGNPNREINHQQNENEVIPHVQIKDKTKGCASFFNDIQIEPVFLFLAMGYSICTMVIQTYYLDRICRQSLGLPSQICDNLTQYPSNEKEAEKTASELLMFQKLIESVFPLCLGLCLGPLTDKFGYKPMILYSVFGYMASIVLLIGTYFMPLLLPKYFLIASIPLGLSGSGVTLTISSYGFMTSQTNSANRSYRLAILSASWELGTVIGYTLGNKIYKHSSFLPTFLYILICYTIAFLYTLRFVREKRSEESEFLDDNSGSSCFSEVFSFSPVKEMLFTFFRKRNGHRRKLIMIFTIATCLSFVAYESKASQYLYTRNKFAFDTEKFSQYSAINTVLSSLGSFILTIFFMKMMKFTDTSIFIINCISNLAAYLIYSLAEKEWEMYLGSAVQMFGIISTAVLKSMLSKCVHKDEFGKLLSLVICAELSMPFISGPLYSFVYIQTVSLFPGAIFLVAAAISFAILLLSGITMLLVKDDLEYNNILNNNEDSLNEQIIHDEIQSQ